MLYSSLWNTGRFCDENNRSQLSSWAKANVIVETKCVCDEQRKSVTLLSQLLWSIEHCRLQRMLWERDSISWKDSIVLLFVSFNPHKTKSHSRARESLTFEDSPWYLFYLSHHLSSWTIKDKDAVTETYLSVRQVSCR